MRCMYLVYNLVLRLYPIEFRLRYERELKVLYKDMVADATAKRGKLGAFIVSIRAISDIARGVVRERLVVSSPWQKTTWLLCLMSLVALVYVDAHASEMQWSLEILGASTFLLGAADPKHAGRWAFLIGSAIPFFNLLLACFFIVPFQSGFFAQFVILIPALISAYCGAGSRAFLTWNDSSGSAKYLGLSPFLGLCGTCFLIGAWNGCSDFTLITPVFILVNMVLCGLVLGAFTSRPILPAALLGFGVPVAIVGMMAAGSHPIRHHYVFVDARAIPICIGSALISSLVCRHFRMKGESPEQTFASKA